MLGFANMNYNHILCTPVKYTEKKKKKLPFLKTTTVGGLKILNQGTVNHISDLGVFTVVTCGV